jgi:hypothetical protein
MGSTMGEWDCNIYRWKYDSLDEMIEDGWAID